MRKITWMPADVGARPETSGRREKVDTDENGNGGDDYYDGIRYACMVTDSKGVYF